MERLDIIGHLGADAEIKTNNSHTQFIAFRVACSTKFNNQDVTIWYDCTISNVNIGVFPYLKKGAQVFVRGIPSYRIYDSAKYHQKFVGVSIYVMEIQLCSSQKNEAQATDATVDDSTTSPEEQPSADSESESVSDSKKGRSDRKESSPATNDDDVPF